MGKEAIRKKIHELVDKIDDESALNMLMEDASAYTTNKKVDELTNEQWEKIESARSQIKKGTYKTYAEVKEHFAQWLTK